jgi:hypothetical protein
LHNCGSVAAAVTQLANRSVSFSYCAVLRLSAAQNVNTATGRKQLMESLRERTETRAFRCCVEFKMENISAFQLAQQKAICARTVM